MSLEFRGLFVLGGLNDLEILPLQQVFDQICLLLARYHLRIYEEELKVDRVVRVLEQEEVSIGIKHVRNLLGIHFRDETLLKSDVHRRLKLVLLRGQLDDLHMLLGYQVIESP
jgi:hypothetical protein